MTERTRIPVVLAATFPRAGVSGGLQRAYGQLRSSMLAEFVDYRIFDMTIPSDGNKPARLARDLKEAWRVLNAGPRGIFHQSFQYGSGIYRDYLLAKMAHDLGYKTILDIRAGSFSHYFEHPMSSTPFYRMLCRKLLEMVDLVHAQVPGELDFVQSNFKVKAVTLYPNVVLTEHLEKYPPADLSKFPEGPVKIVYAGRQHEHKGILETIMALDLLAREGLELEYHTIGSGGSREFCRQVAELKAGAHERLRILEYGAMEHEAILDLLRRCHIYVFASYWGGEGHPNSVNEAMQAGLGLIISAFRHIPDVVSREGTLLVRPESAADIATGIRYYVEHPELLREAGRVNRRWVEEHYVDRKVLGVLLDEYRSLLPEQV